MKWLLVALLALIAVAAALLLRSGGTKSAYVNGLAAYNTLPNREYILEKDCYIFTLKDRPNDWPFLGSDLTVPGLPAAVDEKFIGADLPGVRIIDVARTGSHFRIGSVRRDTSKAGVSVTFEVLFTNESERKYARVDTFWMLDHTPEKVGQAPRFLDAYAVERTGL